jgi:hypothetical protein
MQRRRFLRLLVNAPLVVPLPEPKPAPLAAGGAGPPKPPGTCPICGSSAVFFDSWLDINLCLECGARETTVGWQQR